MRAGRLGATRTTVTSDAYGRGPVQRRLTSLRGVVRSGNSGGPMVDGKGPRRGDDLRRHHDAARGAASGCPNSVTKQVLAGAREPVGTGPCAR